MRHRTPEDNKTSAWPVSVGEVVVLEQLWKAGPVWDGSIANKLGRRDLVARGFAKRTNGHTFLTEDGVRYCVERMGWEKG